MFSPFVCLSLFAFSAQASVELHRVLELPRTIQGLLESHRFKRQFGSDSACIVSCAQDFNSVIQPLGLDQTSTGFLNSQMFDPDMFNSFCEAMYQWSNCSEACPDSQTKDHLEKQFKLFKSLCGEHREPFMSHQACYRDSDPQQNKVCDLLCGGQDEIQELMKEIPSVIGDLDAVSRIVNKTCEMTFCQMDCRISIIYSACKDKEAALFFGRWAQKTMKDALSLLDRFDLDIQCDIINFDLEKFDFDKEKVVKVSKSRKSGSEERDKHKSDRVLTSRVQPQSAKEQKGNLAPKSAMHMHSIILITVSLVFAGLFV